MPELPEVETVVRGLNKLIVNHKINNVEVLSNKSMLVEPEAVKGLIIGSTIKAVRRRAKLILIDLNNDHTLMMHLKMTGQLVVRGAETWGAGHPNDSLLARLPDKTTRVIFDLDDRQLFFNDQRKFGWVKILPTDQIIKQPFVASLGPEPFSIHAYPQFVQRIKKHQKSTVKGALLEQSVIAGLGNIYVNESLYRAHIHPQTLVMMLSDQDLQNIFEAIKISLSKSIEAGGSSSKTYVKADGTKGNYLTKFAQVYGREGKPCFNCGTIIEKIKCAGRGSEICPHCQPKRW